MRYVQLAEIKAKVVTKVFFLMQTVNYLLLHNWMNTLRNAVTFTD